MTSFATLLTPETALTLLLFLPVLGGLLAGLLGRWPNLREGVSLVTALLLAADAGWLFSLVAGGERPHLDLLTFGGGFELTLTLEPLGALFALVASSLWVLNTVFTIGYMRTNREKDQTRFYMFVCFALASTMGVAASGNLLTLFLFYEVLSLTTYPLVAHKGDEKARRGARIYLSVLMGTSLLLFLPAVVMTYVFAGSGNFEVGGLLSPLVMEGHLTSAMAGVLLVLYAFGIGKAALMPVHVWLPNAMVAPTPVSALLHAVAVVKAGVFSILKIALYVFGAEALMATPVSVWLAWIAAGSVVLASLIALTKDNIKERLAYSTVSQLSYVTLGAMLGVIAGFQGGSLQIAMHAFGKITLFMAAGAIYTVAHRTRVSELNGLGKAMPMTFLAFTLGAASIIGLPPMGGTWPKFFLMLGTAEAGQAWLMVALVLSSVLNILYLMPLSARAFFLPAGDPQADSTLKGSWLLWLPPLCAALGVCFLFFLTGHMLDFLHPALPPETMP